MYEEINTKYWFYKLEFEFEFNDIFVNIDKLNFSH